MVKIVQKQDLNQKFSPQQILQANLFQLNSFALEQRLYKELEKNPLLELSEPEIEDETKDQDLENQELENSDDFEIDELYSNTDDFELGGSQSSIDKNMMENSDLSKIDIIDESYKHQNHKKDTSGGHFRLLIVSDDFKEISLVTRHQLIYQALDKMIKTEIHALSIKALSIDEYNN